MWYRVLQVDTGCAAAVEGRGWQMISGPVEREVLQVYL